ncbi:helix-turn-helix domain-containing protein [Rhodococcus pyridinivorans]|uniref:IclR family transcriptional regulator n=1 Tax=Rhodococcus pyridinivorans TaxID=103816 RepID=UPI001E41D9D7|nr:helix-turn-helix domain-containing protein [Rhodococcus pyridinivorans]MCD5422463.1 helix-turn-helix domain-containing protein [Rhodococcus pyridinivorans]
MASEISQTLSRGLDVLSLLAGSPSGLTPAQISTQLELGRTVVYRLVSTLIEHRLVHRHEDGALSIGLGAYRLTENLFPSLKRASEEVLRSLADGLGVTAYLTVLDGDASLAVSVVEPQASTFHLAYREGSRHPLDKGAIGRALVAASRGERGTFVTRDEIIPGAAGISSAVPGLMGFSCAIGIVSLTDIRNSEWEQTVADSVDTLLEVLGFGPRRDSVV